MFRRDSGSGLFELLTDEPRDTPWNKWACGVVFPGLITLWGAATIYLRHTTIGLRRSRRLELIGADAWWFGLVILSVAAGMHFHFFWTNHPKLSPYAELGKFASLVIFIVSVGFAFYNQFRLF